jgi:predicted nucleic acid-binding protein
MSERRRAYIDTGCFIDLVRVDLNHSVESDREHDAWHVKRLLEAHRDNEVRLFTSTLTIAECRRAGDNPPDDAVKSRFTRLLLSGQYVHLVQVTPFITEDARDLTWKHGMNLKGADSIHVASALDRKCEEFLTTDRRLSKVGKNDEALRGLGLICRSARHTDCLPPKYRQRDLLNEKLN